MKQVAEPAPPLTRKQRAQLAAEQQAAQAARAERAERAAKAFRSMLPSLTSYARALTRRNDVKVVMAAGNPCTNGNEIRLRAPIALGDQRQHDRSLCEKRDDSGSLLCPACFAREEVLIVMYHEVAHIAYDSFASTSEADRLKVLDEAIKRQGNQYAQARIAKASWDQKNSYIGLAALVNEYMPVLVNALEDCRVNREMYKARPGTEIMFEGLSNRAFDKGIEHPEGIARWDEQPIEAQICVGVFAKGAGYDYSSRFVPEVVALLDDEKLGDILDGLRTVRTVRSVFDLAFPVLERIQELGYLLDPDMPQPEPEPEPEPQPDGESDDKSDDTSETGSDQSDVPERALGDSDPDGGPDKSDDGSKADDSADDSAGRGEADPDAPGDQDESPSDGGSDGLDPEAAEGSAEPEPDAGDDAGASDSSDEGTDGGNDQQSPGQAGDSGDDQPEASGDDASGADPAQAGPQSDGGDRSDDQQPAEPDLESGSDGEDSSGDSEPSSGPESGSASNESLADSPDDGGVTGTGTGDTDTTGTGDVPQDRASVPVDGTDTDPGTPDDQGDVSDPHTGTQDQDDTREPAPEAADPDEYVPYDDEPISLPEGNPEAAQAALDEFGQHTEKPLTAEEQADLAEMDRAIVQGQWFDGPSANVTTVRVHHFDKPEFDERGKSIASAWTVAERYSWSGDSKYTPEKTPEQILGAGMQRMRVTFDENKAARHQRNLKSGRVNARVLGRRVAAQDDRLFHKKILPGKKDYFVVIGVDISGSTVNGALDIEKAAVEAQAELLSRTGVPFVVYCHTAMFHQDPNGAFRSLDRTDFSYDVDMYLIKDRNEAWNDKTRARLWGISSSHENLDGHTLEFYRKIADQSTATDKIILYYTDGAMPAANSAEELTILQREIKTCKQRGYTLLGVGIGTDSPKQHGLDTVQINNLEDTPKVVRHLERRLSER